MTGLASFVMTDIVPRVGWALLHFVWQGAALALLLAALLHLMRRCSASARYLVSCGFLIAMCAIPVVTSFHVRPDRPPTLHTMMIRGSTETRATSPSTPATASQPASVTRAGSRGAARPALHTLGRRVEGFLHRNIAWIVGIWALGVLLLSVRLAGAWIYLRRLVRRATRPLGGSWNATVARLARAAGLRRPIRAAASDEIEVPSVIGWLRPVLLMPVSALTGLPVREVESLLAHEIAHIRRHDYLVNLLQAVAETVLFYHPAIWWVSRRIRIEREFCCDDLAVAMCGDRETYARALARITGLRREVPALAPAADGGSLPDRIARILGPRPRHDASTTLWTAGFGIVLLLLAIGFGARVAVGEAVERQARAKLAAEIIAAIRSGDGAKAIDLMPRFEAMRLEIPGPSPNYGDSLNSVISRRYLEAFRPPANVDSLYGSVFSGRAKPVFPYQFGFARGGHGCSMSQRGHLCVFGRQRKATDPVYLRFDPYGSPYVTVDLDRDEIYELTFDGERATIRPDLAQIEDRAPDGRRVQWLVAPVGSDPRVEPRIWLYKDGPFVAVVIDIDGDGRGDAGRSDVLTPEIPRPSIPEVPAESYSIQDSTAVADLVRDARQAMQRGDDAAAVDDIVEIFRMRHMDAVDPTFFPEWIQLFIRRYQTVSFRLPANADSMGWPNRFPGSFTAGAWMRPLDWSHPEAQGDDMTFCPGDTTIHRAYLTVREKGHPNLIVDLDVDGRPDVTCDGREVTVIPRLTAVVDRDPDGQRVQWLIAQPGVDPRERAQVWILEDGPTINIAVDVEGDGSASCAHGIILDAP
jgi:beta-lactamase regulating signal transducer with metallopeptidase domain